MLELLLIRHGEPAYPDDALTPRGRREAELLARRLAGSGLAALYTSPMGRARQTAEALARQTGLVAQVAPWLAELESWAIHPPAGEAPAWEIDAAGVRAADVPRSGWGDQGVLATAPGLERDFATLAAASDAFLAGLGYRRQGPGYRLAPGARSGRLALVCHCGLALTWTAHLLSVPPPTVWSSFTLPPASLTTIAFEAGDDPDLTIPRCHGLGDVGHLEPLVAAFDPSVRELARRAP